MEYNKQGEIAEENKFAGSHFYQISNPGDEEEIVNEQEQNEIVNEEEETQTTNVN